MRLRSRTPDAWLEPVLADFDAFLVDHAACERKASSAAMSFAVRYRDHPEIVSGMIELAREELLHFQQVWEVLRERGLRLGNDTKDAYVNRLAREVRHGTEWTRLDRLLVAGVVEARGCERFRLLAEALGPGPLKTLYFDLARAEARHQNLFARLASADYGAPAAQARLDELLEIEAEVVAALPFRAALH